LVNHIARFENAHYAMFGTYPSQERYFEHRKPNRSESRPNCPVPSPNRARLSRDQPSRLSPNLSRRELSYQDLRHRLYPQEDRSERF
jgi:hypothetical protein